MKDTKNNYLYYIFFLILIIGKFEQLEASDRIYQGMAVCSFICVILKIINTRYTRSEMSKIIIVGIIVGLSYVFSHKEGLAFSYLAIVGIKDVPIKRLIRISFYVCLSLFSLRVIFSMLGIIDSYVIDVTRFNGTEWVAMRKSGIGYPNSNITYVLLFTLVVMYVYLFYKKLNLIKIAIIFIIFYIAFDLTYCRTGFFTGIIFIFLILYSKYYKGNIRICNFMFKNAFIIMMLLNYLVCNYYSAQNVVLKFFDSLLSGRINLGYQYLSEYSIPLFGQQISTRITVNEYFLLDSAFLMLLLSYGFLAMVLFLYVNTKTIGLFLNYDKKVEVIILVCYAIYGLSETFIPNIFLNISLIFVAEYLYSGILIEERRKDYVNI